MKKNITLYLAVFLFTSFRLLYSQTPVIMQFDTIAVKGMPLQPVLKIYINAPTSNLTLSKLVIKSYCESFADVDSVAIYRTTYNRFSKADYINDWVSDVQLITKRKIFSSSDSLVSFRNMTFTLQTGDNYFWVLLDLSKGSIAGHSLKVKIPKDSIVINSVTYPAAEQVSNTIPIRQVYFNDNFENFDASNNNQPYGWAQECLETCDFTGSLAFWQSQTGGYGQPDQVGSRNPNFAKSGTYNARLVHPYSTPYSVMLKSRAINLSLATKPELTFYHAQRNWKKGATNYIDSLGVYYKLGIAGSWKFLKNFTLATIPTVDGGWAKVDIILPDDAINDNFYLGFKGTAQWGFGVCVDSVIIFESGTEQRKINPIITNHPLTSFVPQGSTKNPVIRVTIPVKGNTGTITMNSLTVTSGNTNDAGDIPASGISLYYTSDSVYDQPKLIGTAQTFSSNKVIFSGLNRKIETGNNYFWITYDINSNASPDNIIDAKILAGDISFSGVSGTYPATDQSPAGNRVIKQSVFFDDFETDKLWSLRGVFEREKPMGNGGKQLGGDSYGRPDPTYAYSNTNVLGTGLTNDGDYSNNLTYLTADTATSPLIQGKYFKNTEFFFQRWLNIDSQDSAIVEYKYAGENNWRYLWGNNQYEYQEGSWTPQQFNTKSLFDRKNFRIRFRLGPTSVINRYSGWNIDYLFITGDSIKYDAAVTKYLSPQSACGLTANEHFVARIKNTGPKTLTNIPIKATIDGGKTWISEIIPGPINIDDSLDYAFTTPINLSKSAIFNVIVKVAYPLDNYKDNDSITYKLTSIPTYSLPFKTGFEKDTSFWTPGGINSSWFQGAPGGDYIKTVPEGAKCWKTDWSGRYKVNENSTIESPCFSFTGIAAPIVDFQNSFQTQFKDDGAVLEYSLDQGTTWNYISGDTTQFAWPWYNDVIGSLSNKKGWTGLAAGAAQPWQKSKHFFPEVGGQSRVKFRFVFKSVNPPVPVARDGYAFDDFQLYNAPYDIGVKSIDNLTSPVCQYLNPTKLQIAVKNFGIRDLQINDTIIIGIKANNNPVVIDTFKLAVAMAKGTSQVFTMKKSVNIIVSGAYNIKAFTMIEKDAQFYNSNNDTARFTLIVNPNPVTGLKDTLFTNRPQIAKIKAIDSIYYTYNWVYPKTSYTLNGYQPVLEVKNTGLGRHRLKVTNNNTLCVSHDSTFVKLLVSDVGLNKILQPLSSCGYGAAMNPIVEIKNFGTDTLKTNDTIPIRIVLDGGVVLKDTVFLSSKLNPGNTIQSTLSKIALNLSATGSHTLKAYTAYPADTTLRNDTIPASFRTFQIYGYPTVDLGPNVTIEKLSYAIRPLSVNGATSYKWSDGNTTDSMVITQSGKYLVTVANSQGCEAKDSVNVRLKVHDLGVKRLISPLSSCSLPSISFVNVKLMNFGTDTITTSEPIDLRYRVNDTITSSQTLHLAQQLLPGDSISFAFTKTIDLSKMTSHKVMVGSLLTGDIRSLNDSITQSVQVFGFPAPDLGPSTIVKALQYTLDPGIGYKSYLWQDGSTDSSYVITRTHNHDPNRLYKVTVTDKNGCSASAQATIYLQVYDLELSNIMLGDACTLKSDEDVVLKITNQGYYGPVDNDISVWYKINNGSPVTETFRMKATDGNAQIYTFINKANLSVTGAYKITAGLAFGFDVIPLNDTLSQTIHNYGLPQINFGTDTLKVDLPVTLDAGAGTDYIYSWNTGATTQTISVATSGSYTVSVTNAAGCSSQNGVYVKGNLIDLSVNGFSIPSANCVLSNPQTIGVTIKNTGNIALSNQPVTIKYQLNGGTLKTKDIIYTGDPGTTTAFDFDGTEDLSAVNSYTFKTSLVFAGDMVSANNSVDYLVNVFGLPLINNFGAINDTIKLTSWPKVLDAGTGFKSYLWQDGSVNQTFSATTKGIYSVIVTDNNNCTANKSVYILHTGIKKLSEQAEMIIYPNPVRDVLNVKVNLKKDANIVIQLVTAEGKVALTRKLSGFSQYAEQFDVFALPRGLYYIRLYSDDWLVTDKVLIQ